MSLLVSLWGPKIAEKQRDRGHLNCLLVACSKGHLDVVQYLLSIGNDSNKADNRGWTGLHAASYKGHVNICKALIANKADINCVDKDGGSAVLLAAQEGHIEVFHLLQTHGARIDIVDNSGSNALHLACQSGHLEMVKMLASMPIFSSNLTSPDNAGLCSLGVSMSYGHLEVVKYLLSLGMDPRRKDNSGATTFFHACLSGQQKIVEYFMSPPENEKDRDKEMQIPYLNELLHRSRLDGISPVDIARMNGHRELFVVLSTYMQSTKYSTPLLIEE